MPLLADSLRNMSSFMIVAAVTIMGLYYGQDILVPVSLAVLLAFMLGPIVNRMRRAGVPHSLAVTMSVMAAVTIAGLAIYAFSSQMLSLAQDLDSYKANVVQKVRSVTSASGETSSLHRAAVAVERLQRDVMQEMGTTPAVEAGSAPAVQTTREPMSAVKDFVSVVGTPIGKALLTILFAFFLLLQHHDLRDRIIRVAGTNNMSSATAAIAEAGTRLSTLFLTQAALNAAFGFVVGVALWFIGVPNPVLWGIVAAVLRFVPFIGSFLAAIPPLLLAAGVEPGWSMFMATLALYVIGEPLMGHVVEPLVLGKTAGLSPFAIVCALSVWTLLWGPIGLLLAVPITLSIVVLGRYVPGLEFLSVLLGDADPLTPDERLYNRLLSKDASAAIAEIEEAQEDAPLAEITDRVVLPALQLASADYTLDRLDAKHIADMQETMSLVSAAFADAGGLEDEHSGSKDATSLIVVPARGPIDKMAAQFLASLLGTYTPFAARAMTATGLTALSDAKASLARDDDKPAIVVATTGPSDTAQLRLIVNRAASAFPHNPIFVVGLGSRLEARPNTGAALAFHGNWTSFRQLVDRLRQHHKKGEASIDVTASAIAQPSAA